MPKVKIAVDDRNTKVVAKIREYMVFRGTNIKSIAKDTGIPASTIYGWLRDISLIQIGNLRRIYDCLRIPQNERII